MKVVIINLTGFNQYVDLDGNADTNDIVAVGPREKVKVDIPNEKRFIEISKMFAKKLAIKKL
jgi:hypothetical protein